MADEKIRVVVEGENRSSGALRTAVQQIGQLERAVTALGGSSNVAIGRVSSIASAFTGLSGSSLALAGVAGGIIAIGSAATAAAVHMADATEGLDRLAARTDVAVPRLAAYKQILEEGGGSAGSLDVALTFLNRAIATQDPLLEKLGIKTKNTREAFDQLASILSRSSDNAKVTEVAFQLLGRGGVELVPHMKELAEGSDAMEQALAKASGGMNTKALPALRDLDRATDELGRNWKGFLTILGGATAGPVAVAVNAMNDFWAAVHGEKRGAGGQGLDDEIRRLNRQIDDSQRHLSEIAARPNPTFRDLQSQDDVEARITRLRQQLNEVVKLRSAISSDLDRLRAQHGDQAPDSLGTLDLSKPEKKNDTGPSEREKRLENIIRLTGRSRAEAEQALVALEALELASAKRDLGGKLEEAGVLIDPDRALQVKTDVLEIGDGWRELSQTVADSMEEADAAVAGSTASWFASVNQSLMDSLSSVASFRTAVEAMLSGVDRGIKTVVMGFANEAQTLRSAWKTIMAAIRDEALAVIAEIISAMIRSGILQLIGAFLGVPTFNMGPGVPVATGGVAALSPSLPEVMSTSMPSGPSIGVMNVNALEFSTAFDSMTAPGGAMRSAGFRMNEIAAAHG